MKKFVIYSAIIGAYDSIVQPTIVDDDFDYILFTDCITEKKIGVWEVRQIDFFHPTTAKVARYIKTHPHTLLGDYECSLWIDASISITSDYIYRRFKELYNEGTLISALYHPERDCIYDEALAVMMYHLETEDVIINWLHQLRHNHYPEHIGLHETGILYRIHCDEIARINEDWWDIIESHSRRDQLSFDYLLWKNNMDCVELFSPEHLIRNSEHVSLKPHTDNCKREVYPNASFPLLLLISQRFPQYNEFVRNAYDKAFHSYHPRLVILYFIILFYPQYLYKCVKRSIKNFLLLPK